MGIFHLIAGIQALNYKRNAPRLAILYAIISLVVLVVSLAVVYAWLMPMLRDVPHLKGLFGVLFIFGGLIGAAWPIIVWALMSRPSARAACVR